VIPEAPILRDLALVLAAALPVVLVFQRLNLPPVVGFLISGIVIGPHGIGLIADTAQVDNLAELGLILLLFVIGIEMSVGDLLRLGRVVVWSGTLQVIATAAALLGIARLFAVPPAGALVLGFLAAHSSTAIVLKTLADRGELDAPHGRIALGILLVQDLALIPMVLLTRVLSADVALGWGAAGGLVLQAGVAVAAIVVASRLLIPAMLRQIVRLRNRELFTGSIVLCCVGTAWLAAQFGLSLALGALVAGLVISESEYSHQALADILPFRDALNSVFFISIGMLVHSDALYQRLGPLVAAGVGLMLLKALVGVGILLPFQHAARVALLTGLTLAGLGELSFVLARLALSGGLLSGPLYQDVVTVAVLTMLGTPFVIRSAPAIAAVLDRLLGARTAPAPAGPGPPGGHVLIVGFGLNGQNLAHVLQQTGIPYVIVELNPDLVARARARGDNALYGDATRPNVLAQAGAARAHVIVVAISDPVATRRIVRLSRQQNPHAAIIVRTRYVSELDDLRRLGATEVIPEEYETSVEIFARVLRRLRVPRNVINVQVDLVRQQGYRMLRGLDLPRQTLDQLGQILAATTTETFLVPQGSPAAGQTIRQIQLRRSIGVTIIAVIRDGLPRTNPSPDWQIAAGDVLVMLGSHAQLDHAMTFLTGPAAAEQVPE
jgi:CPA2 family monovalent cation:H+ antiporter-2